MTTDEIAVFRARLGALLVRLDAQETAHEVRRRYQPNIYRIDHYLRAADDCATALHAGKTAEQAFAQSFVATRGMHGIAKKLGLRLDVERGDWIAIAAATSSAA